MDDEQLLRYSRQIMLPSIGIEGQQRLLASKVLILGLGGLGSPVAMYLTAAGIGELVLVDFDKVDLTNLQRQIIHTTDNIGQLKVESAKVLLKRINPSVRITSIARQLDKSELTEKLEQIDLIIDGSDNFATRFAVNEASVATRTPLVSGAAIRMEAQISTFSGLPGDPCYRCLYGDVGIEDETCAQNGVLAPLVGIIGSVQATEAIKLLTGSGESLVGRLLLLDALQMRWREIKLNADPKCPVCSST